MKAFASGMNTVEIRLNAHKRGFLKYGVVQKITKPELYLSFKSKRFVCYLIFCVCRFVYLTTFVNYIKMYFFEIRRRRYFKLKLRPIEQLLGSVNIASFEVLKGLLCKNNSIH